MAFWSPSSTDPSWSMSTVPSWPKEDAEYHLTRAQYETLRAIDIAIGAHDFWFRGGPMYKFQFGRKRPGHCVIKQVYGGQSEFARGPDWRHESPFLPYGWKTVNPHGTASLKDTAIRVFMSDQSLLELKHFEVIPYFLADYIWKRLGECDKQTFFMWRMLAHAYPEKFWEICPYYCINAATYNLELFKYIRMMNDEKMHWLGILSVSTNMFDQRAVEMLPLMHNLAALEVNRLLPTDRSRGNWGHPDGLTDGLLMTWAQEAKRKGTLQRLRVIKFRDQALISANILAHLADLPELQFIITQNCTRFTSTVKPMCHPKNAPGANANDNWDPRMHGWIVRTLDNIQEAGDPASQLLLPLIHLYRDPPDQDWQSFQGMRPINPLPFAGHTPVMEFQLPYNDRNLHSYDQQAHNLRNVCCFVRCRNTSAGFKRTSTQRPKRAMKERKIDLMAMLKS